MAQIAVPSVGRMILLVCVLPKSDKLNFFQEDEE